jgi:release factor glutamine methyltransferase
MNVAEIYEKGRTAFMGLELLITPGALVPREETELLGRSAIAALQAMQSAEPTFTPRVIDMCCGAGNLACAIAHRLPLASVWASDLTDGCVENARNNVRHLGLDARVKVRQGDLFAALRGLGLEGSIDAVVCNPPYISVNRLAGDRAPLLEHEPREAFDGGPYGLSIHQRVVKEALEFLRPGGVLLFEIGLGQDRQIRVLFERSRAYEDMQLLADGNGDNRVAMGRRKNT